MINKHFGIGQKHYYRYSQYHQKTMQQKHQQGHWTLHAMEEMNNRCHSILLSWWWIILFNFGLAFFHAYSVLIFQPVLWYPFLLFSIFHVQIWCCLFLGWTQTFILAIHFIFVCRVIGWKDDMISPCSSESLCISLASISTWFWVNILMCSERNFCITQWSAWLKALRNFRGQNTNKTTLLSTLMTRILNTFKAILLNVLQNLFHLSFSKIYLKLKE